MTELSVTEFEKRIESHLRFDTCPHCGGTVDLIISAPMYGRTGARVVCRVCKTQTEYKEINDHFFCKETGAMGTPITPDSLMRGIKEAIDTWNRK